MSWKKTRSLSYFYNMRKYHNYIKRDLYNRYTNENTSVLELAVGKFGDLGKLFDNKVKRVTGYDINACSIEEARRRLMEYPEGFRNGVKLGVKDLSKEIISGSKSFDVVSAMFSFHYFFKSEETFETILYTINSNLRVGGIFMGTMFDGDLVKKRLTKGFNDSHFRLEEKESTGELYGNKMNVFISETVLDEPEDEYIVNFEMLKDRMRYFGFDLVETKLFEEYKNSKFKLNETERDVSYLNRTFVFKKSSNFEDKLTYYKAVN